MRAVLLVAFGIAWGVVAQQTDRFGGTFETLKPPQKALLRDLARRYERTTKKKLDIAKVYDTTRLSDRTTFDAVTHALLTTDLTGEHGKPLGTGLSLVETVDYVSGEVPRGAR